MRVRTCQSRLRPYQRLHWRALFSGGVRGRGGFDGRQAALHPASYLDTADWIGRRQYEGGDDDTYSIGDGIAQFKSELDRLLASGKIFQKCVFTTHGNEGAIFFNHQRITAYELYRNFNAPHYERLFPFKDVKLYFDGCNVAGGEDGWKFLEAAPRTFLREGGGHAMGWTSAGLGLPSVIPWIGGHTEHLWGGVRGVYILPDDSDGSLYISRWGEGAD